MEFYILGKVNILGIAAIILTAISKHSFVKKSILTGV
jgi:hypothetical protein